MPLTIIIEFIGLPVKSIGLVFGWRRASAACSGVSRTDLPGILYQFDREYNPGRRPGVKA